MSTMATSSIEEIANVASGPKMFQLYIHKDQGLTDNLIDRCKIAGFKSLCLTVDTVVAEIEKEIINGVLLRQQN